MGPIKRFRLVVVFLMVAALVAGLAPAAQSGVLSPSASVALSPVGDEPGASGYGTLSPRWVNGRLTGRTLVVYCQGLTPGAPYYCVSPGGRSTTGRASANGTWRATGTQGSYIPFWVAVYRVDPGRGDVAVLSGAYVWWQQ
jgi:hypothetical protein